MEDFNETSYLRMHEDVRLAVEKGSFKSGLEHYVLYGKAEGRKCTRFSENDHFIRDYRKLVQELIASHPDNYELAMAKAIGSVSLESFRNFGEKHVHILKRLGLKDGDHIYDLACGSGRTATALRRNGWTGHYRGADIVDELLAFAAQSAPEYSFFKHLDYTIHADDASQDIVFSWSLFTHLNLEEIYLYAEDVLRALKPGGLFAFSFLELQKKPQLEILKNRIFSLRTGVRLPHLDMFLDRSTIAILCEQMLGFTIVDYIDGDDESATPVGAFGQSIAVLKRLPA